VAVQRLSRTLGVLMLAALVSGCAADPSVEPTPTPTFANEDEAFAAAEATYRAYVDALNQVDLADPATFEEVYAWTTGEANAGARRSFSELHATGAVVTGSTGVQSLSVVRTDLADGSAELSACLDVSSIDVRAPDGSSLVDADRVDIQVLTVKLESSAFTSTGMVVADTTGRTGDQRC